jgi:hypothetical protein
VLALGTGLEAVEVTMLLNRFSRVALVLACVLGLVAPATARGSKPVTMTGSVNTNYRPDNLPSGFRFLDGSATAAPAYVTSLCNLTTLVCLVQPPSAYAGKAYLVYKDSAGKYVPKQ